MIPTQETFSSKQPLVSENSKATLLCPSPNNDMDCASPPPTVSVPSISCSMGDVETTVVEVEVEMRLDAPATAGMQPECKEGVEASCQE